MTDQSTVPVDRAAVLYDDECPACGNRVRLTEREQGWFGFHRRATNENSFDMELPRRSLSIEWGSFVRRPAHVEKTVTRNGEGRITGLIEDVTYA